MKIVPRRWPWGGRTPDDGKDDGDSPSRPIVWLAPKIDDPGLEKDLYALLSPDERSRHDRFRRREDQQRFLTGRGLLRLVAGEHLKVPAEQVTFAYGRFGKPSLARAHGGTPLRFNISHSGELVLLAFSLTHEIGVDIEQIRPEAEWREVAGQVFSAPELAEWGRLDEAAREERFFQTWTRREAVLKASGLGVAENALPGSSDGQQLFDMDLPLGYVGALAMVAPDSASNGPNRSISAAFR